MDINYWRAWSRGSAFEPWGQHYLKKNSLIPSHIQYEFMHTGQGLSSSEVWTDQFTGDQLPFDDSGVISAQQWSRDKPKKSLIHQVSIPFPELQRNNIRWLADHVWHFSIWSSCPVCGIEPSGDDPSYASWCVCSWKSLYTFCSWWDGIHQSIP